MRELSKTVTIFEGCDGSGKSTAAKSFAQAQGARYVHLGPFPQVKDGLARLYAEALLPAVLGYQDVVLDRSWLSEPIYGEVYRDGVDRIGAYSRRMLERLALRCGALVVRCNPGEAVCVSNWLTRKGEEYLDHDEQVKLVHRFYQDRSRLRTDLLIIDYDYTEQLKFFEPDFIDQFRPQRHPLWLASAGDFGGVMLVGEAFSEVKNGDLLYQWPFSSFSDQGCSQWLTKQLEGGGISERHLCWVNADQTTLEPTLFMNRMVTVALGNVAHEKLTKLGVTHETVSHPQHWKSFHHNEPYELVTLLKEVLGC